MNPDEHLVSHSRVVLNPSAVEPQAGTDRCPWCDNPISRSRFLQIQAKIAELERRKLAEERRKIEQEIQLDKETFEARLRDEFSNRVGALTAERDNATTKLKELEERELLIRQEVAVEAEARVRGEVEEKLATVSRERDQAAIQLSELKAREPLLRQEAVAEAEARVREEDEEKLAAMAGERDQAASKLRELEARELLVRQEVAAEAEARVRSETEDKLATVSRERDEAAFQLSEVKAREITARQEAATEAEVRVRAEVVEKLATVTTERDEVVARLQDFETRESLFRQEAVAEAEARVRGEVAGQLAQVSNERDQMTSRLEAITSAHAQELLQQRTVLEQDRDSQLTKLASEHGQQLEQLQSKIEALTRQNLDNELTDVDVYEVLTEQFANDSIVRIKQGQPGANIRHKVIHQGAECGSIVIDAKKRKGWQGSYITKLREDQVADQADHAVLATSVFPAGRKELYIDPDTEVIVVSHARAAEVIGLLRSAMVRMHCLGLSLDQRAEKRDHLYQYLTSEGYRQRFIEAIRLTGEMDELAVEEKKAHDKIWEKRGRMLTRLRNAVREVDTEINAIIEGRTSPKVE